MSIKYRIYQEKEGDKEMFWSDAGDREVHDFVFTGFGNGIHPYHKKEMDWIVKMLASGGIILNIEEVPTVHDMGDNSDSGEFKVGDINLTDNLSASSDHRTYFLIQDVEMGRGWAVLMIITETGKKTIYAQDHRDNLRNELLEGKWIRGFGIDYKKEMVKDLNKI